MLKLLKFSKITIVILILITFTGACNYTDLINKAVDYANSNEDQTLLKELKGTIVFESDRLKQNNTPQLYKVDLKTLKVQKLSHFKIYWETEPIAKDNLVYFLLSLTAYQRGKLSNSIEGLYSININGRKRKKIFNNKVLSIPRMSMFNDKAFVLEGWKRGQDDGGDIYTYSQGQLKKIISYSKETDYSIEDSTKKEILVIKYNNNDDLNSFYFININTGKRRLMLKNSLKAANPAISPDGKRLVFVSAMNTKADLYTINIDGTNLKRITFDKHPNYAPAWSPDGKYIVYASVRDGNNPFRNMTLHVITADGKRSVQITEWDGGSTDTNPTWTYSE